MFKSNSNLIMIRNDLPFKSFETFEQPPSGFKMKLTKCKHTKNDRVFRSPPKTLNIINL